MHGKSAGVSALQAPVPGIYPYIHFQRRLVQVEMIHPNDLAEIQTVKDQRRHLPMNPTCRIRESAVAQHKLKERHGSYMATLQQICYTPIRVGLP